MQKNKSIQAQNITETGPNVHAEIARMIRVMFLNKLVGGSMLETKENGTSEFEVAFSLVLSSRGLDGQADLIFDAADSLISDCAGDFLHDLDKEARDVIAKQSREGK